jgi:hypothetical protein
VSAHRNFIPWSETEVHNTLVTHFPDFQSHASSSCCMSPAGRVIVRMRTVSTDEPVEQLEGLRACLLPTVKARLGPALVIGDL